MKFLRTILKLFSRSGPRSTQPTEIVNLRIYNHCEYDGEVYQIYSIGINGIETYNIKNKYTRIFNPETLVYYVEH